MKKLLVPALSLLAMTVAMPAFATDAVKVVKVDCVKMKADFDKKCPAGKMDKACDDMKKTWEKDCPAAPAAASMEKAADKAAVAGDKMDKAADKAAVAGEKMDKAADKAAAAGDKKE